MNYIFEISRVDCILTKIFWLVECFCTACSGTCETFGLLFQDNLAEMLIDDDGLPVISK